MSDFLQTPEAEEEVFLEAPEAPATKKTYSETVTDYYAAVLGVSAEEVELENDTVGDAAIKNAAKTLASENNVAAANTQLNDILTEQPEFSVALEQLEDVRDNYTFGNFVAPDIAAMVSDKPMPTGTKRLVERIVQAERIVQKQRAERTEGGAASVGYFLDMAISDVVHSPLNIFTDSFIEKADEASALFFAELTEEEFNERFSKILDEVADMGGFTEDNPFYLDNFIAMVQENASGTTTGLTKIFQAFDTLFMTPAGRLATGGTKATKGLNVVTKLGSEEQATRVLAEKVAKGADDAATLEGTLTPSATVGKTDDWYAAPNLKVAREAELDNTALKILDSVDTGDFIDPAKLATERTRLTDLLRTFNKAWKRHEVNFNIRTSDGAGRNLLGEVYLGKQGVSKGTPYVSRSAAQKLADRVGGEVVEQLHEGTIKFLVKKEYNLPTKGLVDPTDLTHVSGSLFSRILSTTARTSPRLDAMIKRGESAGARAALIIGKNYKVARKAARKSERVNVDAILHELGNEPKWSYRRASPTANEFSQMYFKRYGEVPNEATVNYYKAVRDVADLDYYVTADQFLKNAVNNGEDMIDVGGAWYRGRRTNVKSLDPDQPVYIADGKTPHMGKVSDLPPDAVVREVKDFALEVEGVGRPRFVYSTKPKTRRLYHSDVLNYRAGGSRKYTKDLLYFAKQEGDTVKLAGNETAQSADRTFMGARFQPEIEKTVNFWNNIVAGAKAKGITKAQLDELVRRNNDWNINIETYADFKKFAKDMGLNPTKPITQAGDAGKKMSDSPWAGESTVGDGFWSAQARGDEKLIGYGGVDLETVNPVTAIERDTSAAVTRRTMQRYMNEAVEGWVKAAEGFKNPATGTTDVLVTYPAQVSKGSNAFTKFREANIDTSTQAGRRLAEEKRTIEYLMSSTTQARANEQWLFRGLADKVYGEGWHKTANAMAWMETGDPAGFLRAVAFHTKLGMFAVDQLMVQSSQLVNAFGITAATLGVPKTIQTFSAVMPMRIALLEVASKETIERIARLTAPITGIDPQDFIDLRKWIKESGRDVVGRTVVEQNNPHSNIARGKFTAFIEAGTAPFNEGERWARVGAAVLNFAERRAKYPKENIFSDAVKDQMFRRQDILTASMTSSSSAPWQRSLLAVPLQFTTYHVRIFEQLTSSKILTPKERASLFTTHALFYGAASMPFVGAKLDQMGYEGSIDINSPMFDLLRYGMLDNTLSLIGSDTALSTRLAVGEGLYDLFDSLAQDGLMETLAGPGGAISMDVFGAATKLMKTVLWEGSTDYLKADWNAFARNVTSYNRAYNVATALRYGELYNRETLEPTVTGLMTPDAFAVALGIPLKEQELIWSTASEMYDNAKYLEDVGKELKRLDRIATDYINNEDYASAQRVMEQMAQRIALHNPHEKEKLYSFLRKNMSQHEAILRQMLKSGLLDHYDKMRGYAE